MPQKHRARTEPTPPSGFLPLLTAALRGSAIALAVGGLLLFLLAAIATAQPDPDALTAPLGLTVTVITALAAGFLASRFARRGALVCGLLAAACLTVVAGLLSLFPSTDPTPLTPALTAGLHAAMTAIAVVGAYLGRRNPGRRRTK